MNNEYVFESTLRNGPFWKGLLDRGCIVEEAAIEGAPVLRVVTPAGNAWITSTNISYPFSSHLTAEIAKNKIQAYHLIESQGICVPVSLYLRRDDVFSNAEDFMKENDTVVVKPNDSFGSRGVTVGVTNSDTLRSAIMKAQENDSNGSCLIQRQISGDEYRFTLLDGEVVSVLQRQTARVFGDGTSTIHALLEKEDQRRDRDNEGRLFIKYPMLQGDLIKDIDTSIVPASTETIVLNSSSMVRGGASIYEVGPDTEGSYKDISVKIAKAVGAKFVVVDLFIQQIDQPATETNYCFNEINVSPALRLYYAVRNQVVSDLPDRILDRFIRSIDNV